MVLPGACVCWCWCWCWLQVSQELAEALLLRHEEALFGGGGSLAASVERAKHVRPARAPLEVTSRPHRLPFFNIIL